MRVAIIPHTHVEPTNRGKLEAFTPAYASAAAQCCTHATLAAARTVLHTGSWDLMFYWCPRWPRGAELMAYRDWHPGKLVLLWITSYFVASIFFSIAGAELNSWRPREVKLIIVLGSLGIALVLGIVPVVITWKWFSARERPDKEKPL